MPGFPRTLLSGAACSHISRQCMRRLGIPRLCFQVEPTECLCLLQAWTSQRLLSGKACSSRRSRERLRFCKSWPSRNLLSGKACSHSLSQCLPLDTIPSFVHLIPPCIACCWLPRAVCTLPENDQQEANMQQDQRVVRTAFFMFFH
jgi:hypothetical protein